MTDVEKIQEFAVRNLKGSSVYGHKAMVDPDSVIELSKVCVLLGFKAGKKEKIEYEYQDGCFNWYDYTEDMWTSLPSVKLRIKKKK